MASAPERGLALVLDFLNTLDVQHGADDLGDVQRYRDWLRDHDLPDEVDLRAARAFRDALRFAVTHEVPPGTGAPAAPVGLGTGAATTVAPGPGAASPAGSRDGVGPGATGAGASGASTTGAGTTGIGATGIGTTSGGTTSGGTTGVGATGVGATSAGATSAGATSAGAIGVGVPLRFAFGADGRPTLVTADPLGRIAAAAIELLGAGRWERVKICPADDCRWAFYDRSKNRSRQWCSMQYCGNRAKNRNLRQRRA